VLLQRNPGNVLLQRNPLPKERRILKKGKKLQQNQSLEKEEKQMLLLQQINLLRIERNRKRQVVKSARLEIKVWSNFSCDSFGLYKYIYLFIVKIFRV